MAIYSYPCDKCVGGFLRILLWLVGCDGLGNVVLLYFLLTLFQVAFPTHLVWF